MIVISNGHMRTHMGLRIARAMTKGGIGVTGSRNASTSPRGCGCGSIGRLAATPRNPCGPLQDSRRALAALLPAPVRLGEGTSHGKLTRGVWVHVT